LNRNNHGRDRTLTFRLLEEESKILDEKAREADMSKSEFIRNVVLYGGAYPKTAFTREDTSKIIYEIDRIGNALSQISFMTHRSPEIDEREFQSLMVNYMELFSAFSAHISYNERSNHNKSSPILED
jgi:Ribbon-helix-helix protein, copG family.